MPKRPSQVRQLPLTREQEEQFDRLAKSCGQSLVALFSLWRKSRFQNQEAKRSLFRVLSQNPELQPVLAAFAQGHQQAREAELKSQGVEKKLTKPKGAWEVSREKAQGSRWLSVVGGGLPSLGKRR